jgi:hypothetical protein
MAGRGKRDIPSSATRVWSSFFLFSRTGVELGADPLPRRFPIVAGLAVEWDHTAPPYQRVRSIHLTKRPDREGAGRARARAKKASKTGKNGREIGNNSRNDDDEHNNHNENEGDEEEEEDENDDDDDDDDEDEDENDLEQSDEDEDELEDDVEFRKPEDLVEFGEREDGTVVLVKRRRLELGEEVRPVGRDQGGRIYRVVSGAAERNGGTGSGWA